MRRAYVCQNKNCNPPFRVFLPEYAEPPKCPEHGKTMKLQENVPYPKEKK